MLRAEVILPDDRFFPDTFDGSKASVAAMATRVAGFMDVASDSFLVEVYAEGEEALRAALPIGESRTRDAAGIYFGNREEGRVLICIHASQTSEPDALVATLAHELAHVVLLGSGLLRAEENDMEPLTDLATVFLGLGVFTASTAFRFSQWNKNGRQGWSSQTQGYLPEPLWGYALARFAQMRGESKPAWRKFLPENIRAYFDESVKWLQR